MKRHKPDEMAINTDILSSTGSPEMILRAISETGFTHLHWCHQWCTDFLYSQHELAQYKEWLTDYELKLLDIHGSQGQEKCWFALEEYRRKAGVELVINRLEMMDYLNGTGCLMMHAPYIRDNSTPEEEQLSRKMHLSLRRSLDELMPVLERYDAIIAIENLPDDTFEQLRAILKDYPANRIGITYDSGHGNIREGKGLNFLAPLNDRIQALHLNDNDGSGDQHQAAFYGTVDWKQLADILKKSSYAATGRPLSFELNMRNSKFFDANQEQQPYENIVQFLDDAYERAEKVYALYC